MPEQILYSDNDTNTMADVLQAAGLAELVGAWHRKLGHDQLPIQIEDHGSHFEIRLPSPLEPHMVQHVDQPFWAGRARPLLTKRVDARALPSDLQCQGFPYDEMQAKANAYYTWLKRLSPAERAAFFRHPEAEEFAQLRELTPHPDLRIYAYINQMGAAPGYNRLLRQWYGHDISAFRLNLTCVLDSFASCPNAVGSAARIWSERMREHGAPHTANVTRLQLTNPASGKGARAPKANRLTIRNVQGNWLLEYLKLVGLFAVGLPLTVQSRSEVDSASSDRKTYVLRPAQTTLAALEPVMSALRSTLSANTAVTLDILTILRATRVLADQGAATFPSAATTAPSPAQVDALVQGAVQAHGFEVASYRNMGSAHALMEQATLTVPPWLRSAASAEEVRLVRALVREHLQVIHNIRNVQPTRADEGHEEHALFRQYRAWLCGGTLDSFFAFAASYGSYILSKLHRGQLIWPLTSAGVETLMALTHDKQSLAQILENEGFQAIARAIRRSTITAQQRRQRDTAYPYEVRYSVGREIRETAAYAADFLGAVSDFLTSYNRENMRVQRTIAQGAVPDLPEYRRRFLSTAHLQQLAQLVDAYGSELVCRMLVAYGHLAEPRSSVTQETPQTTTDSPHGERI